MNRTEFESKYKAKYLNLLPDDDADDFINDARLWSFGPGESESHHEGYTDDHIDVCWRNYVMQCAIDDLCEFFDIEYAMYKSEAFNQWIEDHPPIKVLFDLRSKEV